MAESHSMHGKIEIIGPDGSVRSPERRRGGRTFRPYAAVKEQPCGKRVTMPDERRRNSRQQIDHQRGFRIDLEI